MDIGEEKETTYIEPLTEPVPGSQPVPAPAAPDPPVEEPVTPEREHEKVPA
jgi:hypothetical protein